jgi:hypothetical protein
VYGSLVKGINDVDVFIGVGGAITTTATSHMSICYFFFFHVHQAYHSRWIFD